MNKKTKNKIIATVVIVGVVCSVFFAVIYPPRQREIARLDSECKKLETKLNMARESLKGFERLQREYDSLLTVWTKMEILLPKEKDIPNLLEDIARVGRRCGVEVVRFKPQPLVSRESYTEMPVIFSVHAGYHQLGGFLSEIGNLPRLLKVRKLHISSYKKEGSADITLQASFVISAYTFAKDTAQVRTK